MVPWSVWLYHCHLNLPSFLKILATCQSMTNCSQITMPNTSNLSSAQVFIWWTLNLLAYHYSNIMSLSDLIHYQSVTPELHCLHKFVATDCIWNAHKLKTFFFFIGGYQRSKYAAFRQPLQLNGGTVFIAIKILTLLNNFFNRYISLLSE